MNNDRSWRLEASICVVLGLPLLVLASRATFALALWIGLVLVYLALLRLFGRQFALEGGLLMLLLSILVATTARFIWSTTPQVNIEMPGTSRENETGLQCLSNGWVASGARCAQGGAHGRMVALLPLRARRRVTLEGQLPFEFFPIKSADTPFWSRQCRDLDDSMRLCSVARLASHRSCASPQC